MEIGFRIRNLNLDRGFNNEKFTIKRGDLHKISSNRFHKVETIDGIEFHCFFRGTREN